MATEPRRMCGFRKVGGMYLVAPALKASCGKLPFPLTTCPCCNQGIKQTRGWTWINPVKLLAKAQCGNQKTIAGRVSSFFKASECGACPLADIKNTIGEQAGLIWIGEQFYPLPATFAQESAELGISRRISQIPRGLELGKTWVFVAHPNGILDTNTKEMIPAIFSAFIPQKIELILTASMAAAKTDEEMKRDTTRGITYVIVPDDDLDHQGSVHDKERQQEIPE